MADGQDWVEEWACAMEILEAALARLKREHKGQQDLYVDLIDQLRICELMRDEAAAAIIGVERLLSIADADNDSSIYAKGAATIAKWNALEPDLDLPPVSPPHSGPPPTPDPEPAAVPEVFDDPPPSLVEARTPSPAEPPPEPPDDLADRIVSHLDTLVEMHGQLLDAAIIAAYWDAPTHRVRKALYDLAEAGKLQYIHRKDKSQAVVLPIGATLEFPNLTDKQQRVFDALTKVADADWRATVSQGRIASLSGLAAGGLIAHIDALAKKDYIRVIDRGGSKTPATYLICEEHRPARAAPPKTDAELIAEAMAKGKVTVCPSPDHLLTTAH